MPRRLFLALLLLVITPIVMLGWLSASATRQSEVAAKEALANLLSTQLYEVSDNIADVFATYAKQLDDALIDADDCRDVLRQMRRENPIVRQGILINREGQLVFPQQVDLSGREGAEIAATLSSIIDGRPLFTPQNVNSSGAKGGAKGGGDLSQNDDPGIAQQMAVPSSQSQQNYLQTPMRQSVQIASPPLRITRSESPQSQWQRWYLGDGAQVIYWIGVPDGISVGIILDRSRWMADVIATLPDDQRRVSADGDDAFSDLNGKASNASASIGSVRLNDEAGQSIYNWGDTEAFRQEPLTTHSLAEPLASWQLQIFVAPELTPQATLMPLYISLGGVGLLLLLVGVYVLTAVRRQIIEASSRVTFAGQVSHELRTPLTNIRLYTELAELDIEKLESSDRKASLSSRLQVIDHESRRLQRLVSGVLEMIRPSGKQSGVRRQETDVCELLHQIAQQFEPSFESAGLALQIQCELNCHVRIDPDVFELVIVNLLSNVEKYVQRGGRCVLRCEIERIETPGSEASFLIVEVSDDGPGISRRDAKRVFQPFERLDDSISAPSGTGIGLTISRRAARRHGGNLVLKHQTELGGAGFLFSLALDGSLGRSADETVQGAT
ncbi:HAMP domain-containing histidine kinase [Stieleria sp. JC731]|uniref:sensor histidine kinase n=1 Tax=Pirellulaceae TaxID=2691357 RepID=UPI001E2AFDD7|nr:HAMP domain-containing sensor histidine kinase [Stieleria sp. JC731]MCC9601963.1 HAMP domain-containing histidine kinase [Stieleria sp. JC731]